MNEKIIGLAIAAISNPTTEPQPLEVQRMVEAFGRVKSEQNTNLQTLIATLKETFQAFGINDNQEISEAIRLFANSSYQQIMSCIKVANNVVPNSCSQKFQLNASILTLSQSVDPQGVLKAISFKDKSLLEEHPRWVSFVSDEVARSNRQVLESCLSL